MCSKMAVKSQILRNMYEKGGGYSRGVPILFKKFVREAIIREQLLTRAARSSKLGMLAVLFMSVAVKGKFQ